MLFGLTKMKTFGIAIGVLLVILLFLGWQYRSEVRKSAQLLANNVQLTQVNHENLESIRQLEKEKQRLEQTLEQRNIAQARIERESRERVNVIERELTALRGQYEDVEQFLSLPVPDTLAQWMRQRQAYSGTDGDNQGEASGKPASGNP